jgi:hypothetical protein
VTVSPPVTLAPHQDFATGTQPVSVAVGDVNGDGLSDLAVANGGLDERTVSVLLNTAAPGEEASAFAPRQDVFTGSISPSFVTLADLNGDGKPDLVTAMHAVSVQLNTTAPGAAVPTFGPYQEFATGGFSTSVAVGDVNGDGKPDLITGNNINGTVSVLLNLTAPGATAAAFANHQEFVAGGKGYFAESVDAVAVGDVNGDGRLDLITANGSTQRGIPSTVSVLLNTTAPGAATAAFANHQEFATGDIPLSVSRFPLSVAVNDVNGDGRPDLITANSGSGSNTVSVLLNTTAPGASAPAFAPHQDFPTGDVPRSVAVGDVNGDGKPDLVTANQSGQGVSPGTVAVLLNLTAPGATAAAFGPPRDFATGEDPDFVAVGDVNGDGKPDLVTANASANTVSVLLSTTAPWPPL